MRSKIIVFLIVFSVSFSICLTQTLDPQKKLIKLDSYLPNDHQVEQGIYLKQIGPFCIDNLNNLYLGDINYCIFHKFDELGQLLFSFGEKGQGPLEFMQVHRITPFHDGLLLMDSVNKKIQILDEYGKYQSSFKILKSYSSMAVSDEGLIYVSPKNTEDHLIDVLDTKGQLLRSFGEKIKTKKPHIAFNKLILSTNSKREVWAAWSYFPYIIRYSFDGKVIKKYTIDNDALKDILKWNEAQSKSPKITNRVTLKSLLNCFYLTENRFYLFLIGKATPRIVEYDYHGQVKTIYEIYNDTKKIMYTNMAVLEKGEERIFYMLHVFPEARVDVYKIISVD